MGGWWGKVGGSGGSTTGGRGEHTRLTHRLEAGGPWRQSGDALTIIEGKCFFGATHKHCVAHIQKNIVHFLAEEFKRCYNNRLFADLGTTVEGMWRFHRHMLKFHDYGAMNMVQWCNKYEHILTVVNRVRWIIFTNGKGLLQRSVECSRDLESRALGHKHYVTMGTVSMA